MTQQSVESHRSSPSPQHKSAQKTIQILKLEAQLSRMKRIVSMEVELRRNKNQFKRACSQIAETQEQLRIKKREAISDKLARLHTRQQQREQMNKDSNKVLAKLKEENKKRRNKMESLISQYKKQYDYVYQKRLSQRRQNLRYDPMEIKKHERQYMRSKGSIRIKTQPNCKLQRLYFQQGSEEDVLKKEKIAKMVSKRIEYGKKAEKEAAHIKIPHQLIIKAKGEARGFDSSIDRYAQQERKYKKAKLDTNLSGDPQHNKQEQIRKLTSEKSPTIDKLTRLKHIVDGFSVHYNNGQTQALDLMCSASIARANLLLKQV